MGPIDELRSPVRRRVLQSLAVWGAAACAPAVAQTPALREMQIHKVPELGLAIWVENQPPWETELSRERGWPIFVAQSPANYHPPAVMTCSSWPAERVASEHVATQARAAIQRAAQNFGLLLSVARTLPVRPARHGVLEGFESEFQGKAQGTAMDVRVFVGQQAGRFPVALSLYTLQGKMPNLNEVVRRSWGNVTYLAA